MLYIIATPIGNLADISFRAIQILKSVDLILTENINHSKKLLNHYAINVKLQAFHEHNEKIIASKIIKQLKNANIALISDAGTPLINDPGYILVSLAKKNNIQVIPIPGASAIITALCASGITSDKFCFTGFVPVKKLAKQNFIKKLNYNTYTSICYESPQRVFDTITIMNQTFDNNRLVCLAKELTKRFETIITNTTTELLKYLAIDKKHQNGEFVIIISPNKNTNDKENKLTDILSILAKELPTSKAAKIAAKITGLTKKQCYEKLL